MSILVQSQYATEEVGTECDTGISVLILRAGQLGALIKYTSRLEGIIIVSNRTNLIRNSNKYCCKYNLVISALLSKLINNLSNCLGFSNLRARLRRWEVTSFCV